jgi:putative membrane protein
MVDATGSSRLQSLHPLSMLFSIGLAAKRLLLPGLIVLVFRPGGQYEIWLMILFVPAVVGALAKYLSFRYQLGPDELVIREGIVTRNERHVPYARIQNIDLVQNPFHRWFKVAEVRVETASGDRPEAIMRVLSLSSVEAMRDHVFKQKRADRPQAEQVDPAEAGVEQTPVETLVRLGWRDLVLLGMTSHRGLTVVAAAMGIFWQLDPFGDVDEVWLRDRVSSIDPSESLAVPGPVATALLVVVAVLGLFVLLSVLSVIWAAVRYHGFTLRECGDDLRSEYGLFTRITATIPRHRIQLLTIRSGPVHRWFGRRAVQIETAGHRGGEEGQGTDRLWLAPMLRADKVENLLRRVVPEVDLASAQWRPIAVRAWKRIIKRGIALALVLSAGVWSLAGLEALVIFFVGVVLATVHARLYVKHARYAVTPEAVVYRSGWWSRKISIVRFEKIQVLALDETPFDRWNRMAAVRVDTAGAGRVGHGVDIRYLEADEAVAMMRRLAFETGMRPFRW